MEGVYFLAKREQSWPAVETAYGRVGASTYGKLREGGFYRFLVAAVESVGAAQAEKAAGVMDRPGKFDDRAFIQVNRNRFPIPKILRSLNVIMANRSS